MKKRIAIHIFWDLVLPIVKGKPGTKERKESIKEIERAFKASKYYPELDPGVLLDEDSYYTTSDFRVKSNKVIFKGSDGKEYSAPKHWIIFESGHPELFKMWDKYD